MAKKKKEAMSTKDMAMNIFSVGGGLILLVCLMPFVPWRYALMNGNLGARFVTDRKYSLFTLGNNFGQGVSWLKMRRDMCMKMEEFNRIDPLKAIIGVATQAVGTGGTIGGCQTWQNCKNSVNTRCYTYMTMGIAGILCMLLILLSAICGFLAPVMQSMEMSGSKKKKSKKKKKEFKEAQFLTMLVSIGGFVPGFFGVIIWIFLSDNQFKALQSTGYYPYPAASGGYFMALGGAFLMFIGMLFGIFRRKGDEEEKEEEADGGGEGEDYDAAGNPEMLANPPGGANVLMGGLPPPPP